MQGFNMGRYRPPDSDPQRESFNRTHPLGKRAHKSSQGILVVRFELPYTIICTTCNQSLAQGTRYNAEKSRVGSYYTTPIWSFRAKCRHCSAPFVIRTDPQNTAYIVAEGGRRKEEQPDEEGARTDGVAGRMVELGMTDALRGRSERGEMDRRVRSRPSTSLDAFDHVHSAVEQRTKEQKLNDRVLELEESVSRHSGDPVALNSSLRAKFRADKKRRVEDEEERRTFRDSLGWREGLDVVGVQDGDAREERKEWHKAKNERKKTTSSATARHTLLAGVKRSKNAVFK